jgi:hypothetical protein
VKAPYRVILAGGLLMIACSMGLADDDDTKIVTSASTDMTLTAEQRKALGIVVEHPVAAQIPDRIQSVGLVLDPTTLVGDLGDLAASEAAQQSAQAELSRLQHLYGGSGGASLKMIEAARAESTKAAAQSRLTAARFAQHWAPLQTLSPASRRTLVGVVSRGQGLLLRADLLGRHSLASLPEKAEVDVDGIQVPGRVLGFLPQTDETQSVGLLLGVEAAPPGLGPGARVPVALVMAKRTGVVLPRDAVLYDDHGPYVFKQLNVKLDPQRSRYERCSVTLLLRRGGGWLVSGVDDDDDIVIEGAGVLWSQQGIGARVLADADDD